MYGYYDRQLKDQIVFKMETFQESLRARALVGMVY
jgi:hypothetical protein